MYIIPVVTPAIQTKRLEECKACKFYVKSTGTCGTLIVGGKAEVENTVTHYRKKIRLCGCVMQWKTKYALSSCPAGKWTVERLDKSEVENLVTFVKSLDGKDVIYPEQLSKLFKWFSKVSGQPQQQTTCAPCVKSVLQELRKEVNRITATKSEF